MASRFAEEEAENALAQLGLSSERERQVVKEMAERLVRRMLYPVSRTVRAGGEPPEVPASK